MSNREQIWSLLKARGLTTDSIRDARALADELFDSDRDTSAFCILGLFSLLEEMFDDPQAVPTAEISPFQQDFLPVLCQWIETPESYNNEQRRDVCLKAFHGCR